MADASDSKSDTGDSVGVQVPSPAIAFKFEYMRTLFIPPLILALISCSAATKTAPPQDYVLKSVELTISKTPLSGPAEFEQYKISGDKIFAECGRIRQNRFEATQHNLSSLQQEKLQSLAADVYDLVTYIDNKKQQFSPAGKSIGLTDPGMLALAIQSSKAENRYTTSFDSISQPSYPAEVKLSRVAVQIRSLLPTTLCDNRSFYGMGRTNAN